MVTWCGQQLNQLSRFELENLASNSIVELVDARNSCDLRNRQDGLVIAFSLGVIFAVIAISCGFGLRFALA